MMRTLVVFALFASGFALANEAPVISHSAIVHADGVWLERNYPGYWNSIAVSSDGSKLVATTFTTKLYTSNDGGATWTQQATVPGVNQWWAVSSSSDGVKLAAVSGGFTGKLFTSTDSGVTWTDRNNTRFWRGITSSSDGTKLAAVAENDLIYTSTDSGATWTGRDSVRLWSSIHGSSDGTKLAAIVSGGFIYVSTDSGVTWTQQQSARLWTSVTWSGDGNYLIATVYDGYVYVSSDNGATWTERGTNRAWRKVAMSHDGTRWAAIVGNEGIYRSSDYGATWTIHDSGREWGAITGSSDGRKWVAAVNAFDGKIYTSTPALNVTMSKNGTPTAFSATLSASDADLDTLTWSIGRPATNGTASASGTGTSCAINYTPTTDWTGTEVFTVQVSDGTRSDVITLNVVVTPVVSYDANGATSGTVPTAHNKLSAVALTLSSNSGDLAKSGFTFAGWNTQANGSGTAYAAGASYTAETSATLYATWQAVSGGGNSGSSGNSDSSGGGGICGLGNGVATFILFLLLAVAALRQQENGA
jgi:Listeria-Bacteroides repeat domain (List_Bact_rpt)/Bacterial Ig domain